MTILRSTTTKMGITISQLSHPHNHMTFEFDSAAIGGHFTGHIHPEPSDGWRTTVFNPGRRTIPNVDRQPSNNLNDAITWLEGHIRNAEKKHRESLEIALKQSRQQDRDIHALFTPKN